MNTSEHAPSATVADFVVRTECIMQLAIALFQVVPIGVEIRIIGRKNVDVSILVFFLWWFVLSRHTYFRSI